MEKNNDEVVVNIVELKAKMFDHILTECIDEECSADQVVVDVLKNWDFLNMLLELEKK